jgi:predicted transcriptional regulator
MNLASNTASPSCTTLAPEHLNSQTHQRLLDALAKRPMTAPELRRDLGLAESCVSLGTCVSELLDAGSIVRSRIEGTHVYRYFLAEA